MKWIPVWVAKAYAILYTEKDTKWFDFEESKKLLGNKEKKSVSRRLNALKDAGFLISKKDQIDRRRKFYRLISPNDVVFSYGIRSLSSTDHLTIATKKLDFVIGGSYAAYIHTGYATPGKMDIYVNEEDTDKWISLMSDKFGSVSVDDMLSEKTTKENVHIHSTLTQEMIENSTKVGGIRYTNPETLAIEGLVNQAEFLLADTFVILIKKRKDLNFDKVLEIAKKENVERELGACLEMINAETKKEIFDIDTINKIHSRTDLSAKRFFPKDKTDEYVDLRNRWNLGITLSKGFISKITTDLIR